MDVIAWEKPIDGVEYRILMVAADDCIVEERHSPDEEWTASDDEM